jgi:hypothetical protein
LSNGLWNEQR